MSNQSVNVRDAYIAPPGWIYLDSDYSQIEFRLSAMIAGEKTLLEGYSKGYDYYKMVYAAMKHIPVETVGKAERQLGKILALGQNYGQEKWGLARQLKSGPDEAQEVIDAYWGGLPATKRAKEEALRKALKEGGVRTFFGRWRPLPDLRSPDRGYRGKAERSVWNTIIQGTAADVMKIALVRAHKNFKGYQAKLLLTVHDEILMMVKLTECIEEMEYLLKDAMEFSIGSLGSIPTEPEWGFTWGSLIKRSKLLELHGDKVKSDPLWKPGPHNIPPPVVIKPVPETRAVKAGEVDPVAKQIVNPEPPPVVEVAKPVNAPVKDDLFDYPCMVLERVTEMTTEKANFVAALAAKFPGPVNLYFRYQGQLIATPFKVQPSKPLFDYFKKALGPAIKWEEYDASGTPYVTPAVEFV